MGIQTLPDHLHQERVPGSGLCLLLLGTQQPHGGWSCGTKRGNGKARRVLGEVDVSYTEMSKVRTRSGGDGGGGGRREKDRVSLSCYNSDGAAALGFRHFLPPPVLGMSH